MAAIVNLSPFPERAFFAVDCAGQDVLVICVAGRFKLPPARGSMQAEPVQAAEQEPPLLTDVYWEEPGASSLRYEGQSAFCRPGTDIYVNGSAWAPAGQRVREQIVRVRVGPCTKSVLVLGDRQWLRGLGQPRISQPQPFESMPLRYERSFGGAASEQRWEPRNPVGCGLYRSAAEAQGRPLPNVEDPEQRIGSWSDRVTPTGLGPLSRSWQPRLAYAGSYDDAWQQHRAPLWPDDFDLRFFQAAPEGLTAVPWLTGGEPALLEGLHPEGTLAFPLPRRRLVSVSHLGSRRERQMLILDAVQIEPDEGRLTLIWRCQVVLRRDLFAHRYSLLRELEPWEEVPA